MLFVVVVIIFVRLLNAWSFQSAHLVEKLFRLVDLRGQVRASAAIRVVDDLQFPVVLANDLLRQAALTVASELASDPSLMLPSYCCQDARIVQLEISISWFASKTPPFSFPASSPSCTPNPLEPFDLVLEWIRRCVLTATTELNTPPSCSSSAQIRLCSTSTPNRPRLLRHVGS